MATIMQARGCSSPARLGIKNIPEAERDSRLANGSYDITPLPTFTCRIKAAGAIIRPLHPVLFLHVAPNI